MAAGVCVTVSLDDGHIGLTTEGVTGPYVGPFTRRQDWARSKLSKRFGADGSYDASPLDYTEFDEAS